MHSSGWVPRWETRPRKRPYDWTGLGHSGYLPRLLGVLLIIGGAGFIARNLTLLPAPAFSSALLLMPMAVAGLPLTWWLLVKGVDVAEWQAR